MPTYEYACTSCRRRFEIVQKFSDAPLTTCEECGGMLKRVFHPVGVVLKGPGFYSTDNRGKKAPGATPKKETASSNEASGKESSGTPSKAGGSTGESGGGPAKKDSGSPATGAGSAAS
jgi:putative FmdB family regulatory protein